MDEKTRFESKFHKTDNDGYGEFDLKTKAVRAHRYSYQLYNGELGDFCVLHKCDNPSCVNPEHLFLGTQLDNIADRVQKGRNGWLARPREMHNMVKLTQEQVDTIRSSSESGRHFAKLYGVSDSTISMIRSGKRWKC